MNDTDDTTTVDLDITHDDLANMEWCLEQMRQQCYVILNDHPCPDAENDLHAILEMERLIRRRFYREVDETEDEYVEITRACH